MTKLILLKKINYLPFILYRLWLIEKDFIKGQNTEDKSSI